MRHVCFQPPLLQIYASCVFPATFASDICVSCEIGRFLNGRNSRFSQAAYYLLRTYSLTRRFLSGGSSRRSLSWCTAKQFFPRPSHSTVLLVPLFPEVGERCRSPVVPGFSPGWYRGMPRRRSPRSPWGSGGWQHEHSPVRLGSLACQVRVRVLNYSQFVHDRF